MATTTNLATLKINYLTQAQYDNAKTNNQINADELYLTPAATIPVITLNGSATTSPSFYAPTSAGTSGYVLKSNGSGAPGWVSATLTDTMVTVAENTKTTKYYPILATGTGTATRQIDTNDKNDSAATTSGLWYQDGVLCAPSLQVGDLDYSLTTAEYNALNTALDAIQ